MYLVSFKIKNFKSYKEECFFSFRALNDDFNSDNTFTVKLNDGDTVRLLKTAVVLGPNASGKSNIISALYIFKILVSQSRQFPVGFAIPYEPFKLDPETIKQDTCFCIEFIENGFLYSYTIKFNADRFSFEELCLVSNGQKKLAFKQEQGKFQFGPGWMSETLDLSEVKMLPNHLFLSELALKPANELLDIYQGLSGIIAEPLRESIDLKQRADLVTNELLRSNDSELMKKLRDLITQSDFAISDIKIIHHGEEEFSFPESFPVELKQSIMSQNQWEYVFMHSSKSGAQLPLQLSDESTGTQHVFSLGTQIFSILDRGGVLAYDEMNMAIHPQLFKKILSLFHRNNPRCSQLLFTTHDTTLLGENVLRADQIWLTEKNSVGESELYSVQDFENVKNSEPFETWYRRGRFGAVPQI